MTGASSDDDCSLRKRSSASTGSENATGNRSGSGSGSGSGKRPRGRPRIETNDLTSKDVRRTQVRNAQRDYRKREKDRISTLEHQATQLHSTIEEMNATFLLFQESARQLPILQSNAQLVQQFEHVAAKFSDLTKEANDTLSGGSENEETGSKRIISPPHADDGTKRPRGPPLQTATPPEVDPIQIGWGYAATTGATQNITPQGQQVYISNYLPHGSDSTCHLLNPENEYTRTRQLQVPPESAIQRVQSTYNSYHQPQSFPFGLIPPGQEHLPQYSFTFSASIPTPEVSPPRTRLSTPPTCILSDFLPDRGLPAIRTHSYEETSFARRLTRATLESGYQLLCQPHTRHRSLESVFRLSLPFITLENLLKKFKWMTSRDINEELDWWDTPFIHLGGAGTHYPRRDPQGNILPLKNSWTVRRTGPFERNMLRLESVADGRWDDIGGVDLSGYDGEWFDAHDVQGYLEEQWACKIDMRSSYAQCLVAEKDLPPLLRAEHKPDNLGLSHGSISVPHPTQGGSTSNAFTPCYGLDTSALHHSSTPNVAQVTNMARPDMLGLSFEQAIGLDLAPGPSPSFDEDAGFGSEPNLGMSVLGEVEELPLVRQGRNRAAWVDVTKLIRFLIQGACCLGRAPGYRPKDVDAALIAALVPPY